MTSNKDNTIFEKTSFLQGSNSPFIKELYLKYLENPNLIPESWKDFFDGLGEDRETIKKEILGPSWSPRKHSNLKVFLEDKYTNGNENVSKNGESSLEIMGLYSVFFNCTLLK